jgi:hypothetical protein
MVWWLAVLYLLSGMIVGFVFWGWLLARILGNHNSRQMFFRRIATIWPEELERAIGHMNVLRPEDDFDLDFDDCDEETLNSIVAFGVCKHCELAWPLRDGVLIEHPCYDSKGRVMFQSCAGSKTEDFA